MRRDEQAREAVRGVVEAGVQGNKHEGLLVEADGLLTPASFLCAWPRLFRRISHLSEREELRPVLDTLSTLSRATLRYFSALS